jgi:drug/metabolite transporter (DMT)-like permease
MSGVLFAQLNALFGGTMMAIGREATGLHLEHPVPAVWFTTIMYLIIAPINTIWWLLIHYGKLQPLHSAASAQGQHPLELKGIAWMALHSLSSAAGIVGLWEGLARSSAATGSLLSRIEVVVAIILGLWLLRETFTKWHWLGFALTVAGMLIVRWTELSGDSAAFTYLLAGAVGFGIAEFSGKIAVQYWPVARLTAIRAWLMLAALFTYAMLSTGGLPHIEPARWPWIIAAALLGPLISRNCYMLALSYLPVSEVVLLNQAQPLYSGLVGFIVLFEVPQPLFYLGALAIILGNITLILARSSHQAQPGVSSS